MWLRTRSESPIFGETDFTRTQKSIYQQRFMAKRLTKGYHADHLGATVFERWYLPDALPLIRNDGGDAALSSSEIGKWVEGRQRAGGRTEVEKRIAKMEKQADSPVGSMMFAETERRLDVLIFRACFAQSVWQGRSYVVHGHVKLNGHVVSVGVFECLRLGRFE